MIRDSFLPLARPSVGDDEVKAVTEVLLSGWWTTGPKVTAFEQALADYLRADRPLHAVALNSCTAALFLALKALGVKAGDEVIVPTWTFAATAQVVQWLGATPVLCDVAPDTLNIDPEAAEALVTAKTVAIMPVHFAGYPCQMDRLQALAAGRGLKLVEDAAHAIGTCFNGTRIGNFADVTCFSFYATKNLAMGEGGAAVSADSRLIEQMRKLAYFGINKEAFQRYAQNGRWAYDVEELGYKFNLDSLHAALGLEQLRKLDAMNARRRQIARRYRDQLDRRIGFTRDGGEHLHTYHLFAILLPAGIDREAFMARLRACNIGTSVHFIPLHRHSLFDRPNRGRTFPVADALFQRIVSIPMFPAMSDADVAYVIEQVNTAIEELS